MCSAGIASQIFAEANTPVWFGAGWAMWVIAHGSARGLKSAHYLELALRVTSCSLIGVAEAYACPILSLAILKLDSAGQRGLWGCCFRGASGYGDEERKCDQIAKIYHHV